MGMTNEEAIEWIEALVETMLHETNVGPFPDPEYRDEVYKALDMAIETMRKYQKIQDIIEYHMLKSLPKKNMSGFQKDILEVLEDGNDD